MCCVPAVGLHTPLIVEGKIWVTYVESVVQLTAGWDLQEHAEEAEKNKTEEQNRNPWVRRGPKPLAHDIGGVREDFGGISRLADQRLPVLATSLRGPQPLRFLTYQGEHSSLWRRSKKLALHPVNQNRV